MTKLFTGIYGKGQTAGLIILCLLAVMISFYGCEKKKEAESRVAVPPTVNPCEVLDKLPDDAQKTMDVNFDNKIKLLGVKANKSSQNQLDISYYWQVLGDIGSFNINFVHFTDQDDKILVQNDHAFCLGKPYAEIKGKFVKETFTVSIPSAAVGKEMSIKLGFYDPKNTKAPFLKIQNAGNASTDWGGQRAVVEKLKF